MVDTRRVAPGERGGSGWSCMTDGMNIGPSAVGFA
jgi:hypothetical protein